MQTCLQIDSDQQIDTPTSADIAQGISALDTGAASSIRVMHAEDAFAQAIRLQAGLFLLEYSDTYGHMAADEPLAEDALAAILNAYVGGDVAWVKELSWAPVEM